MAYYVRNAHNVPYPFIAVKVMGRDNLGNKKQVPFKGAFLSDRKEHATGAHYEIQFA